MGPYIQTLFEGQGIIRPPTPRASTNDVIRPVLQDKQDSSPQPTPDRWVRPLRAAPLFDDTEDLGCWPILISTKAFQHLKQLDEGDGALYDLVEGKIRWVKRRAADLYLTPTAHCIGNSLREFSPVITRRS
jgi:hypothetical protein